MSSKGAPGRRPTIKAVNREGELYVRIRSGHKWIEFPRRYAQWMTDELANLILDPLAANQCACKPGELAPRVGCPVHDTPPPENQPELPL